MKYSEKLEPILDDLSNKEIDLAGGSMVGIVLSTTNALIDYICNLTIGKKKYEDVQDEVIKIKEEANILKSETLNYIDEDRNVLEKILIAYKSRKDDPLTFEIVNKEAVDFCMEVTNKSLETLKLVDKLSKVGNRMLASDFEICMYYSFASIKSSIVNVDVNLKSINDEKYKEKIKEEYNKILIDAKQIINNK